MKMKMVNNHFLFLSLFICLLVVLPAATVNAMPEASKYLAMYYTILQYAPQNFHSDYERAMKENYVRQEIQQEISAFKNRNIYTQEQAEKEIAQMVNEGKLPNYVLSGNSQYKYDGNINAVYFIKDTNLLAQPSNNGSVVVDLHCGDIDTTDIAIDAYTYLGEWTSPQGEQWVIVTFEYYETEEIVTGFLNRRDVKFVTNTQIQKFIDTINPNKSSSQNTISQQKNENDSSSEIKKSSENDSVDVFKLAKNGTLQELQDATTKGAKFDVEKDGDNGDETELFFIGETPLHIAAAFNQNQGVIKFLVSQGLDVNAYASDGGMGSSPFGNPLSCAVRHKNLNAVRELLEAGAEPNSDSYDGYASSGNPVAIVALEYDDDAIAQLVLKALLETGSNVNGGKEHNVPAEFKKSYLLPRSQWSSLDFRKNMTDVSNVDLSYFYGSSTPLMYAVLLGKINIVNTLLDFNANPNIYNAENKLALDYANEAPDYSTIKNSPVFNRLKNATTVASKAIKSDPDFDRADRLVGEGRIPMYVRDKGKFSYNPKFTTVHVNGEGVRLRSQPNTKSNVVGKASGSDFSGLLPYLGEWIHPKGEHWVLSEFNGKSVWIYGKYAVLINDSERFAIENNIRAVKEAQRAAQEAERNRIVDLVRNHMYYTNYTANLGYAPVGQQLERFFPGGEWSVEKNERDKNFDKWFAVYQATTRMRLNNRRTLLTIKFGQAVKNLSVFNTRKGDLALIAVYDNNTPLFLFEATNPLVRDMMNLMNPAFLLNPNSANRYQNSFTLQDFVETIYSID